MELLVGFGRRLRRIWRPPNVISMMRAVAKTKSPLSKLKGLNGATGRIRTGDLLITNQLLYQLSHSSNLIDYIIITKKIIFASVFNI